MQLPLQALQPDVRHPELPSQVNDLVCGFFQAAAQCLLDCCSGMALLRKLLLGGLLLLCPAYDLA